MYGTTLTSQLLVTTHPLNITHSPNMSRMASISSFTALNVHFLNSPVWRSIVLYLRVQSKIFHPKPILKNWYFRNWSTRYIDFFVQSVLNSTLKTSAGCYYYYYISIMLQWSRKCLPFRSIWVHTLFCMGFVLLELQFHGYFV